MSLSAPLNRSLGARNRLWGTHTAALNTAVKPCRFLSQALAPFQSVTRTSPPASPWSRRIALVGPFRGFFPFSVFESRGATYPRRFPNRRLRFVLRVSHPLDALLPPWPSGLVPSRYRSWGLTLRGFYPQTMPYALSNAVPLGVSHPTRKLDPPLQGLSHRPEHDVGSGV